MTQINTDCLAMAAIRGLRGRGPSIIPVHPFLSVGILLSVVNIES